MKRLAAVVLIVLVSTGCAGKSGGARGPTIQRSDDSAQQQQQDHGDLDARPFGQR